MNRRNAEALAADLGIDLSKYTLLDIGEGQWTFNKPIAITAAMAMAWMKHNTENRSQKSRSIDKMSKDIVEGFWHVTHQGIAFRDEKVSPGENKPPQWVLGDGQNRLRAIISSKKSAKIRLFFGLTKTAMLAIDGGTIRTAKDALTLQGRDVQNKALAALKFFLGGRRGEANLGNENMMNNLEKWSEELNFVFGQIPPKVSGITAGVRAVIMRCYHHFKPTSPFADADVITRLMEFCECLATGTGIKSHEKALAKFKTMLTSKQDYGGEGRKAV